MSRRIALLSAVAAAVLIGGGAGGGYYWWWAKRKEASLARPDAIPPNLTDPAARKLIEEKRQRVFADLEDAAAWGELGMAYAAHDEQLKAMACYHRATVLDPDDARWSYLLATLSPSVANIDSATAAGRYRQAIDGRHPSPAHRTTAILTLAEHLSEQGRDAEAAPLYEQAYNADSSDPRAAYWMGVLLANRGETERASSILLGLARNPFARKKSAIVMAQLSRRTGKVKDAEGFEYAAELLPPDNHWANPFTAPIYELRRGRRALMDRYVVEEGAQQDRAAVRTATALADQYPSVETQMMLLRALVNAAEYPAALAVAEDILREPTGRDLVTAHSFLGLAQLGMADRAEADGRKADADRMLAQAAESLAKSVRLKPDYAPGYMYQSKALLRLGKTKEAEEAARAGIKVRPEEWEMYLALADVLAATGRKPEAITTTEQAVKLAHPNEPRPRQALEALKK